MPERGGPTTQSGILYQNTVAALYLGRLCDTTERPETAQVIRVRVEAPEDVDDIVVSYADGHTAYIQAKERLGVGDAAWRKLWRDFAAQFGNAAFERTRDRLTLHVGDACSDYHALAELCERARSSHDAAEWQLRLTQDQRRLLGSVEAALAVALPGGKDVLHNLLAHVDVEAWPLVHIERVLVPTWMPVTSIAPHTLFRLFRDRVGGQARVRGPFEAAALRAALCTDDDVEFRAAADVEALRATLRACNAVLQQHKATLGGTAIHVPRTVTADIVTWTRAPKADQPVGLLLDHAGRGKTVIMRDVLLELEAAKVQVLAVKADQQLSGIRTAIELQSRLGFSEPIERAVTRLAATGPVVVLIDQVDALSLSLARDQQALNVVLELVARLRTIPAVTILLSCRTFDRHTDPRLKRIAVGREFPLPLLEDHEVAEVLTTLGVVPATLSPATRELLRTPLHLDLFASLVRSPTRDADRLHGIGSLQELYGLLWEDVVRRPDPSGPSVADREAVLRAIAARMHSHQQTSVPRSVVDDIESPAASKAADWLASAGVLVASGMGWTFLHQTFFDYCYARFFVEDDGQLVQTVLASDQGLFIRPQVVQVLAYLRGTGHPAYLRTLSSLLDGSALRFHLHELALRWFGALQDPGDSEWVIMRRLLLRPALRGRVLRAMWGNAAWFARVREGPLDGLLAGEATIVDEHILPYLASLVDGDATQVVVTTIARSWFEGEAPWPARAHWLAQRIRSWRTPEAIALYEKMLESLPLANLQYAFELDDVAQADPAAGIRILRHLFDRTLETYASEADGTRRAMHGLGDALDRLDGHAVRKVLDHVSTAAPVRFLDVMLPWLEHAVAADGPPVAPINGDWYAPDPLGHVWVGRSGAIGTLFRTFISALRSLAQVDRDAFRAWTDRLATSAYSTPQEIVAAAYRDTVPAFSYDALRFLLADPRRLQLGDDEALLSRQLITAIAPHLDPAALAAIEQLILTATGRVRPWHRKLYAVRWRGLDQLHLLRALPRDRLSSAGRGRLDELERKFPDIETRIHRAGVEAGFVGSPIPTESAQRMSDDAWLRAMAKYASGVSHKEFLRGGAMQLGQVLQALVKATPQRFARLATKAPLSLDDHYAEAFIAGLAESECPASWVYDVIRRFATTERPGVRRCVARALHQVLPRAGGVPSNLIAMLEQWVRGAPGDDEAWYDTQPQQSLSHAAINTDRGVALRTLQAALASVDSDDALQRRWALLEFAACDPSPILRAAGLDALLFMLAVDQERCISLFEDMVRDQPRLRHVHAFQEFLYYASGRRFTQVRSYISEMMHTDVAETRQRGAELAVLGHLFAVRSEDAEAIASAAALVEEVMNGPPEWRRGAARIYAHNVADYPGELCEMGLRRLLDDPDADVRREVSWSIDQLRPEHMLTRQNFLSAFAGSWAARSGLHDFAEYLWEHGSVDPPAALTIVEIWLGNEYPDDDRSGFGGGEDLVRLALRVYTDPIADAQLRERAMNVFDRLMERFSVDALAALAEWDRG